MVEAVIVSAPHGDIDIGLVLPSRTHCRSPSGNLVAALGKPIAQLLRVGCKPKIDIEAALGTEALGLRGEVGRFKIPREADDRELGVFRTRDVHNDPQCGSGHNGGCEQALPDRSSLRLTFCGN